MGQDLFADDTLALLERLRGLIFPHNSKLELFGLVPDTGYRFALHAILLQHGHDFLGPGGFHLVKIAVHFGFRGKTEFGVVDDRGRHDIRTVFCNPGVWTGCDSRPACSAISNSMPTLLSCDQRLWCHRAPVSE
ncbi:MAG: hypothetical protein CMD33_08900, partial [Flavobacteriales bacterium]|nr:hypothetical protein [Flavobacteriales bacterium]